MNYKDIIKSINNNDLKNMYLFYGREFYLIENSINAFKNTLNESMLDFNLDIIDGQEIILDQVISSIETLPFMDDRKIVIIKDFELLKGKKKNFSDSDEKYLIDYLDNIPESTVLVFAVYGDINFSITLPCTVPLADTITELVVSVAVGEGGVCGLEISVLAFSALLSFCGVVSTTIIGDMVCMTTSSVV